jgi:hypothetical protein
MRWRLLVAVAVVLTAGCGSLAGGSSGTDTLTPVPVPETTPTPDQWPVAPGLTGDAVADRGALVAAHRAATADRSYVWRERRGSTAGNGSVPLFDRAVATVESDSKYHVRVADDRVRLDTVLTNVAEYAEYADGAERVVRYRHVGQSASQYRRRSPVDASRNRQIGLRAGDAIDRYLAVERATVAAVSVDDRRHYEVVGRDWTRGDDRVIDYVAVALVSPEGFVRSLDVSYTVRSVSQPRRVRYSFTYEGINETTVDPPDWDDGDG